MTFTPQVYTDFGASLTALEVRIKAAFDALGTATSAPWQDATLQNGWVNYGTPYSNAGYCKVGGVVFLRGLIKNGTLPSVALTLPTGFQPAAIGVFLPASNGSYGRLDVRADGTVNVQSPSGAAWVSLDGISFPAA